MRGEEPGHVPYCETGIDPALAAKIMRWQDSGEAEDKTTERFRVDEWRARNSRLKLDNIRYRMRAPEYAQKIVTKDGRIHYGAGLIKSRADLSMMQLPHPSNVICNVICGGGEANGAASMANYLSTKPGST